jgi:hypothetical protein
MPRRIRVRFNESGGWICQGDLVLAGNQIVILPADPEAGEELVGLVDHAWVATGEAWRAWARIWISFREHACRDVLAKEATGNLIEEDDRWAG